MMSETSVSAILSCPHCGAPLAEGEICLRCAGQIAFGAELNVPSDFPSSLGKIGSFGDYELLEELARGGMGVVYRARQRSLNREVAVKLMLHGALASAEDVERFRAEAKAAAALTHPGIVGIHEVGEWEGQQYFSMDLVVGRNLEELTRTRPLAAHLAAELMRGVARAVEYAHQQGVLHRDIKPSNVIVDANNRPHVTDFGLARRIQGDATLTQPGQILGTPGFMAPETAAGKGHTAGVGADVYSLGALLYQLLTARPPFVGPSLVDVLRQVAETDPVSPRQLNPEVPRDLETINLKCLAKEPAARYASAAELAEDLERFLRQEPIRARPISRFGRAWRWARRRPKVASLLIAFVVLLVAAVIGPIYTAVRLEQARRQAVALRQESEARLRQGEKLIEFMLGDLAERLEPMGQLAVLDSTIAEVNKFYAEVPPEKMTSDSERMRAKSLRQLGNIRFAQGRFAEAYASYDQSVAAYRKLADRHPENLQWQFELALALNDLGVAYGLQSDFTKCLPVLTESLTLHQALVLQEPRNSRWLMWMGGIAQNLALATVYQGNLVRTGELLRIAEDAERRVVALEPANSKHQEVLALTLGTLGDYLKKVAKTDEAMQAYEEKLRMLHVLVALEPKNQRFRYNLAFGLSQPAQIDLDRGHFREAREALQRAVAILDPLIAADPANRDWQIIRINVLTHLGIASRGVRDVGEALASFQRVWDLSHEHPEMLTAYPRWAADCRLAADQAREILLELATAARTAGQADEAAATEQQAAAWQARANTLPAP